MIRDKQEIVWYNMLEQINSVIGFGNGSVNEVIKFYTQTSKDSKMYIWFSQLCYISKYC